VLIHVPESAEKETIKINLATTSDRCTVYYISIKNPTLISVPNNEIVKINVNPDCRSLIIKYTLDTKFESATYIRNWAVS
jgi:hypothetical protein